MSLLVVRALRSAVARQPVRAFASSNPHGGEGTAYKEREKAAEAAYIRKTEEQAAKLHAKKEAVSSADVAELTRLVGLTTNASVQSQLKNLIASLGKK